MGWEELLTDLSARRTQLDRQIEALCAEAQRLKIAVHCTRGCPSCCSLAVNCSFSEALAIARELSAEQAAALAERIPVLRQLSEQAADLKEFLRGFRAQLGGCPLLSAADGSCSIYSQRPFSCRSLLSTRNSSWCGVDFSTLHPLEKEAFRSSLDPAVVAFPTHYLAAPQELGGELEALALQDMRDSFGLTLSGNLLYQVWIEQEHRLSEIIPCGSAALRDYLQTRCLDLPFLLHLQG